MEAIGNYKLLIESVGKSFQVQVFYVGKIIVILKQIFHNFSKKFSGRWKYYLPIFCFELLNSVL